jgi:hypothetical protein
MPPPSREAQPARSATAADHPCPAPKLQRLGVLFAVVGTAGLFTAAFWPLVTALRGARSTAPGDIPAVSIMLLILAFATWFPSLLTDGSGEGYSTMRVAVLAIVCVFCMLTVKVGWSAERLDQLDITTSWWQLLTIALGGKVAQSFAEAWGTRPSSQRQRDRADGGARPHA